MSTSPARQSAPLSVSLLACAEVVQAVGEGQSMTDALANVPSELRPGVQALSFHTMRYLGWARAVKGALITRPLTHRLLDALIDVSIALLKPTDAASKAAMIDYATAAMPAYAPYTVVDQAVSAADSRPDMVPFKGLINGSLRRFLREREGVEDHIARSAEARWNHPLWWVDLVRNVYPKQWQDILAGAQRPAPLTLRVNRRRHTREAVLAAFEQAGIGARAVGDAGIMLAQPRPVTQLPGYAEGWWSVQDAGAQQAAPLLEVRDGMRVLDACAAPGGKTAHLLELADIELLALDADSARLKRVDENLDRLGLRTPGVTLACADAADLDKWWDGKPFDAVLADVPCTASGIVRRHPDIRWLRHHEDIARTARLQRKILDALWRTVAPGGKLLYVTCSIFPAEGVKMATEFERRHEDCTRLPAPGQLLPVAADASDATLQTDHDGFFYALFAKRA